MPKVMQSTNHSVSTRTRPGEIIHIISVGVRDGGGGGRNECVRLVCQASLTREKLGAGIKQRAGIASCPEFRAAGNLKGLGTPGWRQWADDRGQAMRGGRQPPGGSARRLRRAANPPGRPPPEPWRSRPGARHVAPGGGGGDSSRRTARPAGSTQPPVSSPPSAGGLLDAARNPGKGRAGGAKPL